MMERFKPAWRKNTLVSMRLRSGKFALIQLLEGKGQIAVFNKFTSDNDWSQVNIDKGSVLFMTQIITKSILKRSELFKVPDLMPLSGLEFPTVWISVGSGTRMVKLWGGTSNERELMVIGTGENFLIKVDPRTNLSTDEPIENSNYDSVKDLELTSIRVYPEFNERLHLCCEYGKNFDPEKEIAFNRDLSLDCTTYVDIVSGKVLLSDLGY